MTREALAAIEAAKEAGATEIVVADAHGNGENLLIDQFPTDVRVIRSWPRRLGMVAGIDDSVDAAIFIGYHAGTNNPTGVRAHTFSSANLTRVASERHERHRGIVERRDRRPLRRAGRDDVGRRCGDRGGAEGCGHDRGGRNEAQPRLSLREHDHAAGVLRADSPACRCSAWPPRQTSSRYKVQTPVTVDVSFKNYLPAEVLAYLPMFERTDSHSIRFRAKDMVEASAIMSFIGDYRPDLTP